MTLTRRLLLGTGSAAAAMLSMVGLVKATPPLQMIMGVGGPATSSFTARQIVLGGFPFPVYVNNTASLQAIMSSNYVNET